MARKIYPYSLDRKDAKIAGVASTIGAMTGVDPTFVRIGFVAAAIFISFKLTLLAYAVIGIYLVVQKKKAQAGDRHMSDFDRMGAAAKRKPSIHAMRSDLDETDPEYTMIVTYDWLTQLQDGLVHCLWGE